MTDDTLRAREIAAKYFGRPTHTGEIEKMIAAALTAARNETWLAAAEVAENAEFLGHRGPWGLHIAQALRAKAEGGR